MNKTHHPVSTAAVAATLLLGLAPLASVRAQTAPTTTAFAQMAPAPAGQLTIQVDQPGVKISPIFYGLMTEEINYAFDGGLYAELVRNRAFKDAATPVHWSLTDPLAGTMALDLSQPVPNTTLTNSLRLDATKAGAGVQNDGFWGVPVMPNTTYQISFWAKAAPDYRGELQVGIESNLGQGSFASTRSGALSTTWRKYTGTLKTGNVVPSKSNSLAIRASAPGTVWMTMVSLFPPTYKNRPNGNRVDLMEKMAAMKPTFLRFPGGNYLDPGHYEWKKTIGPLEQREIGPGAWGYPSSNGLGLLEFLYWCEDLNIEPVLGVTVGRGWLPDDADISPLVQDALDEIEYVSGDAKTTKWGALRAAHGHPAPFPLRFVEIGNEDNLYKKAVYEAKFARFYDAIRAKYPDLKIIATRGDVSSRVPDIIDDHFYKSGRAMAADAGRYDETDRQGPKIFVGEWASMEGEPTPTMQAALGDAAWLTGLLRNSDHVIMEAYAPLFTNVNPKAWQWSTNLIGYDALHSFGSPAYYVQTMFGQNTGDTILPVKVAAPATAKNIARGGIGVGTWGTQAQFDDIKVTAPDGRVLYSQDFQNGAPNFQSKAGDWNAVDGVYAQTGGGEPAQAFAGDANWTDYTLTLRARKTGGDEGFLIPFHVRDADNYLWWNVGGWSNSRSRIQRVQGGSASETGTNSPFQVETNRWYDLKIEVSGDQIRAYADGKLINQATDAAPSPFYSVASRDSKTGDIMLEAVNFSAAPQTMKLNLAGAKGLGNTAMAQVLTGLPGDQNSIENPTKIAPRSMTLTGVGPNFSHTFPAYSVTVMRFKAQK